MSQADFLSERNIKVMSRVVSETMGRNGIPIEPNDSKIREELISIMRSVQSNQDLLAKAHKNNPNNKIGIRKELNKEVLNKLIPRLKQTIGKNANNVNISELPP